ncbi:MAG: tetratricopeptide repeat protein [Nitrospirota bacterium]
MAYQQRGDLNKALEIYEDSINLKEKIGDETGKALTLGQIGYIYEIKRNYNRALDNYQTDFTHFPADMNPKAKTSLIRCIQRVNIKMGVNRDDTL